MTKTDSNRIEILCCTGSPHKHREELEGPLEKYPKKVIKAIIVYVPTKIIILVLFTVFIVLVYQSMALLTLKWV
jgi:hypothetical protein